MENKKLIKLSIFNSVGVFIYSLLVSLVLFNGEEIFGKADNLGAMIILLMIMVLSVTIVGALIFGKPVFLYLDGNKKESIKLLIFTILSLFVITLITAGIYIIVK